jgi:hypothetical protein
LMKQLASSLQMTTCSKPDFLNLHQHWCVHQTCCKLFYLACCKLTFADWMQLVSSTCIINLHQVCKCQLAASLISTGVLQVDDVNKPAATCWQLAAGR